MWGYNTMKYTIYFTNEIDGAVDDVDINFNFQSRQMAMKYFSKKYPTKYIANVVKNDDGLPIDTKLDDLSILEIHLICYLFNTYKEHYNSDYITNAKVIDFRQEFTKKLNLDYFSDINKYISYSLFYEYSRFHKTYEHNNIIYNIICNEFNDIVKQMKG